MPTKVKDFMKTATSEQQRVLFELLELTDKEKELMEAYKRKIEPLEKDARNANELIDGQMAQIIREDAYDLAIIGTIKERGELEKVRERKRNLLMEAVRDYEMGHLGLIQREYERYVGEPLQTG